DCWLVIVLREWSSRLPHMMAMRTVRYTPTTMVASSARARDKVYLRIRIPVLAPRFVTRRCVWWSPKVPAFAMSSHPKGAGPAGRQGLRALRPRRFRAVAGVAKGRRQPGGFDRPA